MCDPSFKGYLKVSLGMETINEFGAVNLKHGPLYDNEDFLLEIGDGVLVMKFNVSMAKPMLELCACISKGCY